MDESFFLELLRATGSIAIAEHKMPQAGAMLDSFMAIMLTTTANELKASHCVLWEASVDLDLTRPVPRGRLYAVHSTFPGHDRIRHAKCPAHLERDFTGRHFLAASSKQGDLCSFDNDILNTDKLADSTPFLREKGLTKACTARWEFGSANSGSLTVYRRYEDDPFGSQDVAALQQLAVYIPILLHLATNQFVADLVSHILGKLYGADSAEFQTDAAESHFKNLDAVCRLLAETFVCAEASVFLHDRRRGDDPFQLMGSNLLRKDIKKRSYQPSKGGGLTSYVLASHTPVVVFEEDRLDDISDFYPGIRWLDGAGLSAGQTAWSDAPRGFLGVPIFDAESLDERAAVPLGVLRCSIRTSRYYFSHRDTEILQIVASLIGAWWVRRLGSRNRAERQKLWEEMAKISDALNERIHRVLAGVKELDDRLVISTTQQQLSGIYSTVVQQSRSLLGATVVAFRRREEQGRGARQFKPPVCDPDPGALMANPAWSELPSAADEAIRRDEPVIRNLPKIGNPEEREIALLCVPVSIAGICFGVIDFVFDSSERFNAILDPLRPWARTVGRQLALYEFLIRQVIRLEELKASQLQTYANMAHQLNSPLLTAVSRSQALLEHLRSPRSQSSLNHIINDLEKLAGACRKTQRVADTMEMLARLVQGKKVNVKIEETSPDLVFKFARELLEDHLFARKDDDKKVRIDFGDAAAEARKLHRHSVRCDHRFIQQALDAIIDNAFKYSLPDTTIKFTLERVGKFQLLLKVTNTGIRLTDDDARRCTERSFRGEEAEEVDQEGSGLGLWLAKELMELQNGKVKACPTNSQGETTFEIATMLVVASGY